MGGKHWEHAAGEKDVREVLFLLAASCVTTKSHLYCWQNKHGGFFFFYFYSFYLPFGNICSCFLFGCHGHFTLRYYLKWINVCLLLPHSFLLFSSRRGYTSLSMAAPTATFLSSWQTNKLRLSLSQKKAEKISMHHHLTTLLNPFLYTLCYYFCIWLDIACFLKSCLKKLFCSIPVSLVLLSVSTGREVAATWELVSSLK